jgi:hypothetical protein
VLQWVGPKVYAINVPPDPGISFTLNVEDLFAYTGPTIIPNDPFKETSLAPNTNPKLDPIQPSFPPVHKENIDAIWMRRFFFPGMEVSNVSQFVGGAD